MAATCTKSNCVGRDTALRVNRIVEIQCVEHAATLIPMVLILSALAVLSDFI